MLYHFWKPVIRPILKMSQPRSIVEIGAEEGKNTQNILEYCAAHGAVAHIIDPYPLLHEERWKETYKDTLIFHQEFSLDSLPKIPPYDAILIDGDHNWYTVYHELLLIEEYAKRHRAFPMAFVHDIGWPNGRRDSYVNPERIPTEFRNPYEQKGVLPGRERLGTQSEGAFRHDAYFASREGGPRNGILTAMEDFLAHTSLHIRCILIPGMYGLGILIDEKRIGENSALSQFLSRIEQNPLFSLIDTIESERVYAQAGHHYASFQEQRLAKILRNNEAPLHFDPWKRVWKRGEGIGALVDKIEELEVFCRKIYATKSWRLTAPLRFMEASLRSAMRKVTHGLLPQRSMRKNQETSVQNEQVPPHEVAPLPPFPRRTSDIAVVIPCHNYGRYLPEAIESVLQQSLLPREILVVDDSSEDATASIARRYQGNGVGYTFGTWKSVAAARNEGARLTKAPYLLFLDADDHLLLSYLAACKKAMEADPLVAIVYGDIFYYGDEARYRQVPAFDRDLLMKENYISSCALIRRQAFDMVGGYRECYGTHQDWDLYRRILTFPWQARRAETYFFYRMHTGSMRWKAHRSDRWGYCRRAMLLHNPVTIFTPFAGRETFFPAFLEALRRIEFDPMLLHIHWHDTSGNAAFGKMLRQALATLSFEHTTYTAAPLPPSWGHTPTSLTKKHPKDEDDARYYTQLVVSRAYNSLLTTCDTEFALTLEDDIFIAPDTLQKLLEVVEEETVAVLAPYFSRFDARTTIREFDEHGRERPVTHCRSGVEEVAGGGFGCTLFRMSVLRGEPLYATGDYKGMWYDHRVFERLRTKGKILCRWDAMVRHEGEKVLAYAPA